VAADIETLVRIGKKLKKNNVALDIVSFGEEDDGKGEKLEALLGAVNSNDNSHLVQVSCRFHLPLWVCCGALALCPRRVPQPCLLSRA